VRGADGRRCACVAIAGADFGPAGGSPAASAWRSLREGDREIDLLLRADSCLYRAKRTGRNCVAREAEEVARTSA
jgi:GGDEF domain-containing protein